MSIQVPDELSSQLGALMREQKASRLGFYPDGNLIARFMAVSQELALNIAARADAEIAELRRDAERYRWLRDKGGLDIDAPWCVFQGKDWHGRNELDAAIDAARGGE